MPNKKVLIVDDEMELVEMMKKRLEANHYDVLISNNGEEGMAKALSEVPNLILLDIKMPKMDGYTFIKQARTDKRLKHVPIIVLSVIDQLSDLLKLEGVNDYLEKPFDADVLLNKISQYLKS
ncbi:MAG: response regulator [Candidatus Omnitrophica bacterium]|nr:response regulator [Candidatus Omnitrophota bacterium]